MKQYTIDQFLANTAYGGASFSPDGRKILVSSNQTGVFNVFAHPGRRRQAGPAHRLQGQRHQADRLLPARRALPLHQRPGRQREDPPLRPVAGRQRPRPHARATSSRPTSWAGRADEKGFFFLSNERDPSAFDLYEMAVDGYERKLLYTNDGGYDPRRRLPGPPLDRPGQAAHQRRQPTSSSTTAPPATRRPRLPDDAGRRGGQRRRRPSARTARASTTPPTRAPSSPIWCATTWPPASGRGAAHRMGRGRRRLLARRQRS